MLLTTNRLSVLIIGVGLLGSGCSDDEFEITTPAFKSGDAMPAEYTCANKNFPYSGTPPVDHTMPELSWTEGPDDTQSYAIVFRDVTLTTVTAARPTIDERGYHWAIWNIPASVRSLPKGLPSGNPVAAVPGAEQYSGGLFNDGYIGPCPSWAVAPGANMPDATVSTDNYTFTVYAFSAASLTKPAMRTAVMDGPPISYVKDLDDAFIAQSIGKASLGATSNAQPAMFALPPPAP